MEAIIPMLLDIHIVYTTILGIRLVVGQQPLELHGKVRILHPQPIKLLFEKKPLVPAIKQLISL
jgi:hypothetical protein